MFMEGQRDGTRGVRKMGCRCPQGGRCLLHETAPDPSLEVKLDPPSLQHPGTHPQDSPLEPVLVTSRPSTPYQAWRAGPTRATPRKVKIPSRFQSNGLSASTVSCASKSPMALSTPAVIDLVLSCRVLGGEALDQAAGADGYMI